MAAAYSILVTLSVASPQTQTIANGHTELPEEVNEALAVLSALQKEIEDPEMWCANLTVGVTSSLSGYS